jgi:putative redox protein
MDVMVDWHQGMNFSGLADSGFEVALGSGPDIGGAGDGFRPLELMALSLAGCTAMDVISILVKKQQIITAFEVKVRTEQADQHPRVFTHARITYIVRGRAVEESALLRAIELSAQKYCPAQAMLGKAFPMDLVYEIYEQGEAGEHHLVNTGKYQPKVA